MPFLVISVEGTLRAADPRFEEAADHPGRLPLHRVPPGHPAADHAGHRGRRGPGLGAGARRVRGDDHLRRQLPGPYPDHAARGLPRPAERPGGRDRAQPGPARRLRRRPGRPARPLDDLLTPASTRPKRRGAAPDPHSSRPPTRAGLGRPTSSSTAAPSAWTSPSRAAPGDVRRAARPERRRQDHRPAGPRRARPRSPAAICASTARRDWTVRPPEYRPVGVVFQDYLLFPHLTALDNVAFGPRCHGRRRGARPARRPPSGSTASASPTTPPPSPASSPAARPSGSPLARALATRPRLLLLDEPLAALDARTRLEVRAQLRRHLAEFEAVAVLVTHDPLDAMVLADRLVVVEHGRVVQEGTPADIARRPAYGLRRAPGRPEPLPGARPKATPSVSTPAPPSPPPKTSHGRVFVAFPPSAVTLYRDKPTGSSARNLWLCEVGRPGDPRRPDPRGPHR